VDFVPHEGVVPAPVAVPPAAPLAEAAVDVTAKLPRDGVDPVTYATAWGAWSLVEWGITDHLTLHPHLAHGHAHSGAVGGVGTAYPQPKMRMGTALDDVDSGSAAGGAAPAPGVAATEAAGGGGGGGVGGVVDGNESDDEVEVVSRGGA